jgi:hypothetical protein
MTGSETLSAIGFFFTLTSLLGTLFYVQLSNWYRELLELKSKFKMNQYGDDNKKARLECAFQIQRLYNHVPLLVSAVLTFFILAIGGLSLRLGLITRPFPDILLYYLAASIVFLVIYLALTGYFLVKGYAIGKSLTTEISEALDKDRGVTP